MKKLRIIVAGSRNFQDYNMLKSVLLKILIYLKKNKIFTDKN